MNLVLNILRRLRTTMNHRKIWAVTKSLERIGLIWSEKLPKRTEKRNATEMIPAEFLRNITRVATRAAGKY
jgi:hypothetical protein